MAGRPTKLNAQLVKAAERYLEDCRRDRMRLPTVEGLALRLGINRDTVREWAAVENPTPMQRQFSGIVSDLKEEQGDKLVQNGLSGRYNATIAKLILSGKHGYVEKSAQDLTTNGKDLPAPILGGATQKETKDGNAD